MYEISFPVQLSPFSAFKARVPGNCPNGDYDCGYGVCIPLNKVRDGRPDCLDLSDECKLCASFFRAAFFYVVESSFVRFSSRCLYKKEKKTEFAISKYLLRTIFEWSLCYRPSKYDNPFGFQFVSPDIFDAVRIVWI